MIRFRNFIYEQLSKEKFDKELNKLNSQQQSALRKLLTGRTPTAFYVDKAISKATVEFGKSVHFIIIGPKGKIISHEISSVG
jgi:hypothetical protein